MEEFNYLQEDVNAEDTATDLPEGEVSGKDEREFEIDGTVVSKSEFIRHQFTNNNLSRKEISEQFDINYRTVYGATVNMVNDAEPTTRGRSAANTKIKITSDNEVVVFTEEGVTLNGEILEGVAPEEVEVTEVDRNTWIIEQVQNGANRGDIAKALGLSYGVIYGLTKEVAGASQRHEIDYEGKLIPRSEYIRILFAQGLTKGEIAKQLDVDYPVVWSALKGLKSEHEKFLDAVARLEKFAGNVADPELFAAVIAGLKGIEFKSEEEESTDEASDAEVVE